MIRRFLLLIPLFLILGIFFFFHQGLKQDPRLLPSTLIGRAAPHFELNNLLGSHQKTTEAIFKGKYTILNVWASWCETCQEEQAFLMTIPQNKQLQLIGLNYKDDPRAAKAWLKAHGNPYQLVLEDRDGKTAINYGVYGTPETFLIDPTGKIVAKQVGVLDSTHFKEHFLPRIQQKS